MWDINCILQHHSWVNKRSTGSLILPMLVASWIAFGLILHCCWPHEFPVQASETTPHHHEIKLVFFMDPDFFSTTALNTAAFSKYEGHV